jgi:hypothetical protein
MPTILELFRSSTIDTNIETNPSTFLAQEVSGLRIKSAVELNNPLLYGNEAIRIANRSTKATEDMRASFSEAPDGGLIGGKIKDVRDKVNDKLGIPTTIIPTSYDDRLGKIDMIGYPDELAKIKSEQSGSFVGNLLSGGTPKTIAQQAAGKLIGEAKDAIRGKLFGESPSAGSNAASIPTEYFDRGDGRYSKQLKDSITETATDTALSIDLVGISPEKYIKDNLKVARGYKTKGFDGEVTDGATGVPGSGDAVRVGERDSKFRDSTNDLPVKRGFSNTQDGINQSGLHDTIGENEITKMDFIPLQIKAIGGKAVNFRATITGLTENVSPSWDSAKFVGNPFNYYTYSGIERSVSFNFTVFPMNLKELINNWNKIEYLTSLCYPLSYVGTPGYVQAPFLFLTLGDMYAKKPSFIESLTYTVPDNGTWEIGVDAEEEGEAGEFFGTSGFGTANPPSKSKGYRLPHFLEVAVTFKFVEHRGNSGKTNLYSFKSLT